MSGYERAARMPMTGFDTYPDAMPPIWNNNDLSQRTSSAAFLEGEAWIDRNGAVVLGTTGIGFGGTPLRQRIDVIQFNDDGTDVGGVTGMTFPMEPGRFRSGVTWPGGGLSKAVDEGRIHKPTPGI